MPSLTLNTDVATDHSSAVPPPSQPGSTALGSQAGTKSSAGSEDAPTSLKDDPSASALQAHIAISQDGRPGSPLPPHGSDSPQAPPYSPITPPLRASELPDRPEYTHINQLPQTAMSPPKPEPIDFASNPDVLALQSAIAILQMQKRKAAVDMVALSKAKEAALADPAAFLADLGSGRVGQEGDNLFISGDGDDDSSSDDETDMDEEATVSSSAAETGDGTSTTPRPRDKTRRTRKSKHTKQTSSVSQPTQPWHKLPKPQNVVRMPAINWAQYAVVGESLDKLHQEQVHAPTQGSPAVMQADGTYEFTFASGSSAGGVNSGVGGGVGGSCSGPAGIFNKQEKLVGIAAPYNPSKDKLHSQRKGSGVVAQSSLQQQAQQSHPKSSGVAEAQGSASTGAATKR